MQSLLLRLGALLMALGVAASAFAQGGVSDGVTFEPIRPSETDASLRAFNEPHWVYLKPDIVISHLGTYADRHELLLWLPGTRPRNAPIPSANHMTRGASHTFCIFAANLGYHVIALSYPNAISTSACVKDPDPDVFAAFHRSIIAGGITKQVVVSQNDCVQNRLIRLLQTLNRREPTMGWDQFLNADGSIPWEKIAVAGQSQGGGHAAFIGVRRHVARVLCFGAPKDYSRALDAPAAWFGEPSATPKELFFAFNHEQDRNTCTPEHQLANLRALSMEQFGAPVSVDQATPPYKNSHILMTNFPGTKVSSETAHASMINPANQQLFSEVWRYMLTAEPAVKSPTPATTPANTAVQPAKEAAQESKGS